MDTNTVMIILLGIIAFLLALIAFKAFSNKKGIEKSELITHNAPAEVENTQYDKIVYKVADKDIFSIIPINNSNALFKNVEEVEGDTQLFKNIITSLNPELGKLGLNFINMKQMRVSFSPEVQLGLETGAYKLMESGSNQKTVAIDSSTGKIKEIGNLSGRINPATIATLAWQFLAMVTAQKYLVDIDKKLSEINIALNDIRNYFKKETESKIIGNFNVLIDILETFKMKKQSLNNNDITVYGGELKRIYTECSQLTELLKEDLNKELFNFKNKANNKKTNNKEVTPSLKTVEIAFQNYCFLLNMRVLNIQLQSYLPISSDFSGLNRIKEELDNLQVLKDDLINNSYEQLSKQLSEYKKWDRCIPPQIDLMEIMKNMEEEKIKNFEQGVSKMMNELNSSQNQVLRMIEDKENKNPVDYIINLDDNNQIISVKKLLD